MSSIILNLKESTCRLTCPFKTLVFNLVDCYQINIISRYCAPLLRVGLSTLLVVPSLFELCIAHLFTSLSSLSRHNEPGLNLALRSFILIWCTNESRKDKIVLSVRRLGIICSIQCANLLIGRLTSQFANCAAQSARN